MRPACHHTAAANGLKGKEGNAGGHDDHDDALYAFDHQDRAQAASDQEAAGQHG